MSEDWLVRYADTLGVPPLTDAEMSVLLDLARDVAHGSERRFAPLSTFLAGAAAQNGTADRETALRVAAQEARELLADG